MRKKAKQEFFLDSDGNKYFLLSEIAMLGKYSLDYLHSVAKKGHLKSFKIGEDWFTKHSWLEEFEDGVRNAIDGEIEKQKHNFKHFQKWVKHL
ncbi:MAG: hypothetical protein WCP18_02240 [bacterium]